MQSVLSKEISRSGKRNRRRWAMFIRMRKSYLRKHDLPTSTKDCLNKDAPHRYLKKSKQREVQCERGEISTMGLLYRAELNHIIGGKRTSTRHFICGPAFGVSKNACSRRGSSTSRLQNLSGNAKTLVSASVMLWKAVSIQGGITWALRYESASASQTMNRV